MHTKSRITAKQSLAFASLLMVAVLLAGGVWYPDSFLMSFADTGIVHSVLRGLVIIGLAVIVVSRPPRSERVRLLLGTLSSIILAGACASMVDYHVGLLDAVVYLLVSIVLALEALEPQPASVAFSRARSIE